MPVHATWQCRCKCKPLYETDEEWQKAKDEQWYQTITESQIIAASHVLDVWEEAFNHHDADMQGRIYAADAILESQRSGQKIKRK